MDWNHFLNHHQETFHPLVSPDLTTENTWIPDLSGENPALQEISFTDSKAFGHYIFDKMKQHHATYAYGGYMEDRELYRRSPLFTTEGETPRSIHLGIDIWTTAGTPVYVPLKGLIHSFQDNAQYGDYGPTIIMKHTLNDTTFFTLYGHLTRDSLESLTPGMAVESGEQLCKIGNAPENGDWPPHLHFQIITDIMDRQGDFPGVCLPGEKDKYRILCPDPKVFFPGLYPAASGN
ncbi:MAG: peptidoglycan DD-metalloendopeptidase family protein [Bacteroidales bacterium]